MIYDIILWPTMCFGLFHRGSVRMSFNELPLLGYLGIFLVVLLVWYVIYKLLTLIRGTKAVQLLKGIIVIVFIMLLITILELHTLFWLVDHVMDWGLLAIIVLFQPELLRALEQLGREKIFSRGGTDEDDQQANLVEAITKATDYMAKRRIGALISIERQTGMGDYVETGIPLHSAISSELLINIF